MKSFPEYITFENSLLMVMTLSIFIKIFRNNKKGNKDSQLETEMRFKMVLLR